jgi:hypothetical protein
MRPIAHTLTASAMDGGVPCGTPCKEEKCMQNFVMKAWREEATSKDLRVGGWAIRRIPLKKGLPENVHCCRVAQNRNQWRTRVNTAVNLRVT